MEQSLFHLFCWTYLSESFGKYILHVIGYLCSIFEWKDKCPILLEWPIMPLPITWSRHRQISLTHNICVSNTFKLAEHKTCPKNYTNHVCPFNCPKLLSSSPKTTSDIPTSNRGNTMDTIKWEAGLKYQLWCKLVISGTSAKNGTDAIF